MFRTTGGSYRGVCPIPSPALMLGRCERDRAGQGGRGVWSESLPAWVVRLKPSLHKSITG